MSSFVWPPPLEALTGGPQTYQIGATFTGAILGGGTVYARGIVFAVSGGLLAGGGDPNAARFNFFTNYLWFPDGGILVGGTAPVPSKFRPDADFIAALSTWTDDVDFPAEEIGGD